MSEIQQILDKCPTHYDAGQMIPEYYIKLAMIEYARKKCAEQHEIDKELVRRYGIGGLYMQEPEFENVPDPGGT